MTGKAGLSKLGKLNVINITCIMHQLSFATRKSGWLSAVINNAKITYR